MKSSLIYTGNWFVHLILLESEYVISVRQKITAEMDQNITFVLMVTVAILAQGYGAPLPKRANEKVEQGNSYAALSQRANEEVEQGTGDANLKWPRHSWDPRINTPVYLKSSQRFVRDDLHLQARDLWVSSLLVTSIYKLKTSQKFYIFGKIIVLVLAKI